MQSQPSNMPPNCQSPTALAHAVPIGPWDAARLWMRRLRRAALRRLHRFVPLMFGWLEGRNDWFGTLSWNRATPPGGSSLQPLRAGDVVEVISYEDIRRTLDQQGRCDGLELMDGMKSFCGKRLVVMKKVEILFDEAAQRMLKIQRERYILEGAICDGRGTCQREGCDRCCFYFWSRPWLRRIS